MPAYRWPTCSAYPLNRRVGRRPASPIRCSVAWLQRGWGTAGLTFEKNPYSDGALTFHVVGGWSDKRVILTIDLIPLKPYFQGTTSRSGAPFWAGSSRP